MKVVQCHLLQIDIMSYKIFELQNRYYLITNEHDSFQLTTTTTGFRFVHSLESNDGTYRHTNTRFEYLTANHD